MDVRILSLDELAASGVNLSYWPGRDMASDHDHCFLCGCELTATNRTDEHVFPKWLLRDFDLWDVELTLPNTTPIPYRQLRIACCTNCNNFWLSRVEDKVAEAFRTGPAAVDRLDKPLLCLWMAKIYYGLRFKELVLPIERSHPSGPTIVERWTLARLSELHHILQAARSRVRLPRAPGSVRTFRAQVPDHTQKRFDFRDVNHAPYLAIRVGATVVVGSILDWSAMENVHEPYFDVADQLELHPIQFNEVAAYGAYLALRFNWRFAYRIVPHGDYDAIEPIRVGTSEADRHQPPFRPFVLEHMAVLLAEFTRWPIDDVYQAEPPGLWSSLLTAAGQPYFLSLDVVPADAVLPPPKWFARTAVDPARLIDIR